MRENKISIDIICKVFKVGTKGCASFKFFCVQHLKSVVSAGKQYFINLGAYP